MIKYKKLLIFNLLFKVTFCHSFYCRYLILIDCFLQYLGRTHNMWHRACLQLEQMAFDGGTSLLIKSRPVSEYEFEPATSPQQV